MKVLFFVMSLILVNCTTRENPPPPAAIQAATKVDVKMDESRVLFGPAKAPVTIVKYADFQCPACSMDVASLEEIKKKYGSQVRVIHKNVPLEQIHPQARLAAEVFEALLIENKEKAQKFYKLAYESQRSWNSEKDIWALAKKAGGSQKSIQAQLKKETVGSRIHEDLKEHQDLGFRGTPAYMINGVSLYGAQSFEAMSQTIDLALKK